MWSIMQAPSPLLTYMNTVFAVFFFVYIVLSIYLSVLQMLVTACGHDRAYCLLMVVVINSKQLLVQCTCTCMCCVLCVA